MWSCRPYLEIYQAYRYHDPRAEGFQYLIIDESGDLRIIRIFHRLFSRGEVESLLAESGFRIVDAFRDLAGSAWVEASESLALFCQKINIPKKSAEFAGDFLFFVVSELRDWYNRVMTDRSVSFRHRRGHGCSEAEIVDGYG